MQEDIVLVIISEHSDVSYDEWRRMRSFHRNIGRARGANNVPESPETEQCSRIVCLQSNLLTLQAQIKRLEDRVENLTMTTSVFTNYSVYVLR